MKTIFSSRLKLSLGAMLFSLTTVFAQNHERQIDFLETFGLPSAEYNAIDTYLGWRETSVQYIGQNVDVRNTQHSCQMSATMPTYLKGSGDGNIYFSGMDLETVSIPTESGLLVKGINTSNYTDLQLQFGYRKHVVDILPILNLSYSVDNGTTWNDLSYQFAEQADAAIGWYLSPVINLPEQARTSNLWLRFIKPASNSATNTRIDDLKITGLHHFSTAPVAIEASNISSTGFTANWQAVANAQKYILEVSDNANFSTNTDVTLAGWTFPGEYVDATAPSTLANIGTAENIGIASISKTSTGDIYSSTGPGGTIGSSISINSSGWENGVFSKYYQIKLNANGYSNLKLSSKSLSSANGPRYLTVQYKLGNSDLWLNVPNSDIDNYPDVTWNTAAMPNDLSLPSACDNQSELYIRWVVAGGVRADDTKQNYAVTSGGASRMTDIVVKGQQASTLNGYASKEITGTSETLSNISGTNHYYRVKAVDANNYQTNFSNTIHVTSLTSLANRTDVNPKITSYISNSSIVIYNPSALEINYQFIDLKGRILKSGMINQEVNHEIERNGINKGIYILKVESAAGCKSIKITL